MIKVVKSCLWCHSKNLDLFTHRKDGVGILMCNDCNLYMVDKIPSNLKDSYYDEEAYYNAGKSNVDTGYGETYDLMSPAFLLWQNSIIEGIVRSNKKMSFLEVGCATGELLGLLMDNQKNLDIEGIDVSEYAIKAAKQKGFNASVSYIEDFASKLKKDIIFSSETMEHLDDLKGFMGGIKNNLDDNGVFIFYVPSIAEEITEDEKSTYSRFNTNLEHLLHFTPSFLKNELSKFLGMDVIIEEISTDFGPCIIGVATKDRDKINNARDMFEALQDGDIKNSLSNNILTGLVVISLKFARFELAEKIIGRLQNNPDFDKNEISKLMGLLNYHKGNLVVSNSFFELYLGAFPGNIFAIRSILANEREINRIFSAELNKLHGDLADINARLTESNKIIDKYRKNIIIRSMIKTSKISHRLLSIVKIKAIKPLFSRGAIINKENK